jgi:hypothetical protein
MIKALKKYQIQMTPFNATKDWALNNTGNDDLLLFESTGSEDGIPFALEYVDYGEGNSYPIENSSCSIALEQQGDDLAIYNQGLKVVGPFYPETDPQNPDGTYKRPIYYQVKTTFYNTYFDPSKIWGSDNIDTELSKTKRVLSDKFYVLDIPKIVYGEKILPNTVNMVDETFDNSYYITDDGNGNLLAGTNVFLRQQVLGEFQNVFTAGYSTYCDAYFNFLTPSAPLRLSALLIPYHGAHLTWETASVSPVVQDSFIVQERDVTLSQTYTTVATVGPNILTLNYSPLYSDHIYAFRVCAVASGVNSSFSNEAYVTAPTDPIIITQPISQSNAVGSTASFNISVGLTPPYFYQWMSGSTNLIDNSRITGSHQFKLQINNLQDSDAGIYKAFVTNSWGSVYSNTASLTITSNVIAASAHEEGYSIMSSLLFGSISTSPPLVESTIPRISQAFLTGSVVDMVITISGGNETSSVNSGFYQGSIFNVIIITYGGNETASVSSGFNSGYIFNVILPIYGENETGSLNVGFYSGSTQTLVIPYAEEDDFSGITTTLLSGSIA